MATAIIHTATTVAALTAVPKASLVDGDQIQVAGYVAAGDKEAVTYVWSAASTATANGGTVLAHDDGGTGRFLLRRDAISAKDFGTVGDSTMGEDGTDNTAALQAAINHLVDGAGGELVIEPGIYRITGTLNIGLAIHASYEFVTERTDEIGDDTIATNTNLTNVAANQAKSHIHLNFRQGAVLVADWEPTNDEPVIAYNLLDDALVGRGKISNASIVTPAFISGGRYTIGAGETPVENNLIGVFCRSGCVELNNTFTAGIGHGVVTLKPYWAQITDTRVWRAGHRCVDICGGNAMSLRNSVAWYSAKGLVFDGSSSLVDGFHTEQVEEDVTIFAADSSEFKNFYLEDVLETDGTDMYAVRLGTSAGAQRVILSKFQGIRAGSVRPNKKAFLIEDTANCEFDKCREYSNGVDRADNYSNMYRDTDFSFSVPSAKWGVTLGGVTSFPNFGLPGSPYNVHGPYCFAASGIAPGSIASGGSYDADISLPASLNDAIAGAIASVTYTSGGSPLLVVSTRILYASPNVLRVTFANPTAGAIDPGSINIMILVHVAMST